MRLVPLALAMLLCACGGGADRSTNDPTAQNVAAAAAKGTPAKVTAAAECSQRPDFVPVYSDAVIATCTSGPAAQKGHESGTIIYNSASSPHDVLGWSRAQVDASGLGQRILTDNTYSAGEESERNIMILVEPVGSGSKVTINWGRER